MSNENKQKIKVEKPSIEITVRVDEQELCVCSFFDAGANEWDVLVGISDPEQREPLAVALGAASEAVRAALFRRLPSVAHERGYNAPPF